MKPKLLESIKKIDASVIGFPVSQEPPAFDPDTHYSELASSNYYRALISFRHIVKILCDEYMGNVINAYNVDLFMFTNSISSPMGPGSDSEAINIKFGNHNTHLVDSSQFGFEPLLLNEIEKVYCYLPSMRGESPDKRHLNQFYHCEVEIKGGLENIVGIGEDFVKFLSSGILRATNHLKILCRDYDKTMTMLNETSQNKRFRRITFDQACKILEENNHKECVNYTKHGRDINSKGEIYLMKTIKTTRPVWMTHFDRDRVPFYQKPDPNNPEVTLNADLLFPPILEDSFGGEILGSGQRQDSPHEIIESIKRQKVDKDPYQWYIDLRKEDGYSTTSGFGLGIERYLTWVFGLDDIKLTIPYPRLKNIKSTP